ncbi:TrbC/VIRB2 family protein [uncultured archaeon]|nr:TrbC/VIRB2 family protein [uncultured archaeon]
MKGQILSLCVVMLLVAPQVLAAVDFSQQPSAQDQTTFDQILAPVMKIYNLVKYFASALAGIALLIAGVTYMVSGSDPKKRDGAKSMAMYVVIGLLVIWAAPMIVSLIG